MAEYGRDRSQVPGFVDLCRRWDLQVVVLSDGMDRVVGRILTAANGMKLPYFANQLVWQGGDRWTRVSIQARGL